MIQTRHELTQHLNSLGRTWFSHAVKRHLAYGVIALTAFVSLYFWVILLGSRLAPYPPLIAGMLLIACAWVAFRLRPIWSMSRDPYAVARLLETQHPHLGLKVRSALDFLASKCDVHQPVLQRDYVDRLTATCRGLTLTPGSLTLWTNLACACTLTLAVTWFFGQEILKTRYLAAPVHISEALMSLEHATVTIYEPEYTRIPGRTLPLKPGTYEAYPGSRLSFAFAPAAGISRVFYQTGENEAPVEIQALESGSFAFEKMLLEPMTLRFLLVKQGESGKTPPIQFRTKTDLAPEVVLQSHTPEGLIDPGDPLFVDVLVKDDFGVAGLEAVTQWDGGERRIPLTVPDRQNTHFSSRQRWRPSDLVDEDVSRFRLYLEATDNNPINGPGKGQSEALQYELENPDKAHDELMELARVLLDRMTHTLGDNLETNLTRPRDRYLINQANQLSDEIETGLIHSHAITGSLLDLVRKDEISSALDEEFILGFRRDLTHTLRRRRDIQNIFASMAHTNSLPPNAEHVGQLHGQEEVQLENMTYDLLLQLKMWAMLAVERSRQAIDEHMDTIEDMLERAAGMEMDELDAMIDQLFQEMMSEIMDMLEKTAQEMDRSMDEFLNAEGLQNPSDFLEQIKEAMKEALRNGDEEALKKLMEQLRQMMNATMAQMEQALSQDAPEVQAMMAQLQELFGLLRELKLQEEALEKETQELKRDVDEALGGNELQFSEEQARQTQDLMQQIIDLLDGVHRDLTPFQNQESVQQLLDEITGLREQLNQPDLEPRDQAILHQKISRLETQLGLVTRDALHQLQNLTLRSLETAETMQETLLQGELIQTLDTGMRLEQFLLQGERVADQDLESKITEQVAPKSRLAEARRKLYEIMDAIQNQALSVENRRSQHLIESGSGASTRLAQKQSEIMNLIEEFKSRASDLFDGSQIFDRLDDVGLSMSNAERKLRASRLDNGIYFEQEALRKLGEMMEQMQQMSQKGMPRAGLPMGMANRQLSMFGNPIGDVVIPDSNHQIQDDQLKDAIRKQLLKDLPESYGKEIKKYYEQLMDQ